ncbi:uncharacterized protein LOC126835950 [Adelges cooleyi]|uniref:uncharacterized protein LOC126835950 n=1 Tax=Adelges cooleyi TaxID=133065 RepID=UPI00217FE47B|nr:uncharacterized protein LOC126835950 [Adelges cooleyi]
MELGGTSGKDKTEFLEDEDGDCCMTENYEGQNDENSVPLWNRDTYHKSIEIMCYFIAWYWSIKFPTTMLDSMAFEDDMTCLITHYKFKSECFMYKKINGIWYQTDYQEKGYQGKPLKKQLDEGPTDIQL